VLSRLFATLAPEERLAATALPLTLLVRPLPVLALVVLGVNDHVLKGSGWLPDLVTGKLSDFAGLFFFPLLLVTLWNLLGHATFALRARLDRALIQPSATTMQLVVAAVATGVFFTAVQIHPAIARLYARISGALLFFLGGDSQVTMDPTDLVALPMVVAAVFLGQRAIGRVPPGRLPWILYSLRDHPDPAGRREFATAWLRDVRAGAPKGVRRSIDELSMAIADDANPDEYDELLSTIRER
jgi:hypothetical protein